ncbi:unnamed protein product [Symbiodinium microadriaticum]|nr:unnamed protein product [Symbiodinium microadriaticum]
MKRRAGPATAESDCGASVLRRGARAGSGRRPRMARAPSGSADEPLPNLAIYLEEVKYYLTDVLHDDWQGLLKLAASNIDPLILVPEEVQLDPRTEDAIGSMYAKHILTPRKCKCPLILVIEQPTEMQRQLMYQVERLQFLCKGRATVFPYPELTRELRWKFQQKSLKAVDMLDLVSPYYDFVGEREPQWVHQILTVANPPDLVSPFYNAVAQTLKNLRPIEQAIDKSLFARCAAVVMLFSDERGDFVWTVWDAENDGGQWAFPGGDVIRKVDGDLLGTAQREWNEEVLGFEFETVRDSRVEPVVLPYLAGESARYPVQTYVYAKATAEFFESTRAGRDRFRFEIPPHSVRYSSRPGSDEYYMLNTDPTLVYVEHDWGVWSHIKADGPEVPKGEGPPGRKVLWENVEALKVHRRHISELFLSQSPLCQTAQAKGKRKRKRKAT